MRRSWFQSWSLRKRLGRASAAMLVLLAVLFTVTFGSLVDVADKGNQVINRWQPAYTLSQDLLADLVNQETGLRGFAVGRDDVFLEPFREYEVQERAHEKVMTGYLSGRPDLLTAYNAFRSAAEKWRTSIATPLIRRVRSGDQTVAAQAVSRPAKATFDRIRAAAAALTSRLGAVRESAKRQRVVALRFLWVAVSASAGVSLAAGFVLWRGLRTSVLEPVEQLAAQTRDVARGQIGMKIVEAGPPEISGLGRDVDTMRARIASELARVERARAAVMERSAELARSNADLEQFAYVASHDLSEPLRKVTNFCQLLERQYAAQLDDKAKLYIGFAVDGAKRMQTLIADLLSFSRVARSTEMFVQVDTGQVLERALANLDDRISGAGAEIVRGRLPTVEADPTLLVALFQNLVGNAVKYRSAERSPRIEIIAERRGADWMFTIADNGIGIDPQYADRIFTIFQRLHLRDEYDGTGIGLALCRKIVEFHRGQIWLGTNDDRPGATFHFTIPERGAVRNALGADEY
jgi:signal transduction histidine kinase